MHADIKGALNQLDKSYSSFVHKGKRMSLQEVKAVLEYALSKGYTHTDQLSDDEVDQVINSLSKFC